MFWGTDMFKKLLVVSWVAIFGQPAAAQSACDVEHVLQSGDTLLSVAETYYGDRSRWSMIYYANEVALSGNLVDVPAGIRLSIPCLSGSGRADPKPLLQGGAGIRLLTGSNYEPFSDLVWEGHGMATELINAAMEETPAPLPYSITWENDWSKHLVPMLDDKKFDMGFPWFKPDCDADPANAECKSFHFSDPIFKVLILLYTKAESDKKFEKERDFRGKTICRPEGFFTYNLHRKEPNWLTDEQTVLKAAENPKACFQMLMDGKVDAVTINEFIGSETITEMGLKDKIAPFARPVSEETLHVVISKKHWRGTTHLYRFNAGLEKLKQTKRYEKIVSKHLGLFWVGQTTSFD
jgi:polar amino acid transport system substrate-binding protein